LKSLIAHPTSFVYTDPKSAKTVSIFYKTIR